MPLLHDEERTTWNQWFVQQGLNARRARRGRLFEDGLLTLAGYRPGWAVR